MRSVRETDLLAHRQEARGGGRRGGGAAGRVRDRAGAGGRGGRRALKRRGVARGAAHPGKRENSRWGGVGGGGSARGLGGAQVADGAVAVALGDENLRAVQGRVGGGAGGDWRERGGGGVLGEPERGHAVGGRRWPCGR